MKLLPLTLAVVTAFLSGCASIRPSITAGDVKPLERPIATPATDEAATVINAGYELESAFLLQPMRDTHAELLPAKRIENLTLTESSVYDALQLIAAEAGLQLVVEGGPETLARQGAVAMFNVSGTLEQVLERSSKRLGFFWRVEDDSLVIEQQRQYIVNLPPALASDTLASTTNMLQYLGARDVYLDRDARAMAFRADRKAYSQVDAYLQKLREDRPMLSYEVNIWQVDLADTNNKGIDWTAVGGSYVGANGKTTFGLTGTSSTGSASTGVGISINAPKFTASVLLNYLETQGKVKTLSQPQLAILAGTKGSFEVGKNTTYISQVGTNNAVAASQTTATTATLQTGLQMGLYGEYHDKTIYTRISLKIADLLQMKEYQAIGGTSMKLPETSTRGIDTQTRARPGDMLILGGLTLNQDTIDTHGGATGVGKSESSARSELVIAVKPKIIFFSKTALDKAMAQQAPVTVAGAAAPAAPLKDPTKQDDAVAPLADPTRLPTSQQ